MYAARHASFDRKIAFQEFIRIMFYQIIILQGQKKLLYKRDVVLASCKEDNQ